MAEPEDDLLTVHRSVRGAAQLVDDELDVDAPEAAFFPVEVDELEVLLDESEPELVLVSELLPPEPVEVSADEPDELDEPLFFLLARLSVA